MATSQINLSVDANLKAKVDQIFSGIGLTTTEAIRMFLRQTAVRRGLPLITSQDDLHGANIPVLELSAEGYRNLAKALEDTERFAKAYEKHLERHEKFLAEHNIKVKE